MTEEALSGAASGAAAGSMVMPGWGTVAGAAIGAGASLIGGSMANESNAKQAEANRRFQEEQARIQREWSDQQAKNAMQFEGASADKMMNFQNEQSAMGREFNMQQADTAWGREVAAMRDQQAFNQGMANNQNAFNKAMADSAWQRGTADMRAAGINPMLAYMKGGADSPSSATAHSGMASAHAASASAPSGAMGTGKMGSASQPAGAQATMQNILSPAFASAVQGASVLMGLENLGAQIERTQAETALIKNRSHTERENPEYTRARTGGAYLLGNLHRQQTATERLRGPLVEAETHSAQANAGRIDRENARFDDAGNSYFGNTIHSGGQILRWLRDRISRDLTTQDQ